MSADIESLVERMSLAEKIGQMFMGNFCGSTELETAMVGVREFKLGGFQYSSVFDIFVRGGNYRACGVSRNKPLAEVAQQIFDFKNKAFEETGIPLIIGCDNEGGVEDSIFRRRESAIVPAPMGIAATGNPKYAYQSAKIIAREVRLLGVDMLYGPCLDINNNPKNPEIGQRSFGDNPQAVAEFGAEVIRAYRKEGIISNAKHFPGRGAADCNAHHDLGKIKISRKRLFEVELLPFIKAIEAGVDSIMVGHTLYPLVDKSNMPASLSFNIVTKLLRKDLGFDGVIIPDTLTMFAISRNFEVPEACVKCIAAGSDMIFMKVDAYRADVINAIKSAVKDGTIPEDQINTSVVRILKMKKNKGLFERRSADPASIKTVFDSAATRKKVTEISRRSIVDLSRSPDALPVTPIKNARVVVINPRIAAVTLCHDKINSHHMLRDAVAERCQNVEELLIDETPTDSQVYEAEVLCKRADLVIFGLYHALGNVEQLALANKILALNKNTVIISAGSPYQVEQLKNAGAVLGLFGLSPVALRAAVDIITGRGTATGTLPVRIK